MRISDRYIGWQVLYGTIFAVTLLTVVLIFGQIFKQIRPLLVEQAAPLWLIGKFVLLILPFSLMFTLPWGFLASTLLSFGRLSGHNELIGFRMAGLSLTRVALPVLVVGAGLSGLCYWLTGTAAPAAKEASRNLIYEAVRKDPRALLDPGVVQKRFANKRVYVERRADSGELHGIHIYELSGDSRDAEVVGYVYAETVDVYVDEDAKQLRLKLKNALFEYQEKGEQRRMFLCSEAEPMLIDFSAAGKKNMLKPSDVRNADIPDAIELSRTQQAILRTELATGELDEETARNHEYAIAKEDRRQKELRVQLQKRRSLSMACLAFALVGVPLGISARRRETSNGLLLSLVVAAAYFGIMIFSDQIEDYPLPVLVGVVWLPNLLCLILGVWLFRRASFR